MREPPAARASRYHRSPCRALLIVAALVLPGIPPVAAEERSEGAPAAVQTSLPKPAYVQRGEEVEARYLGYRGRLERFFQMFGAWLKDETPDLPAKLHAAPPAPVPYGYQILPKVIPDPPRTIGGPRVGSASYSWRRTDGFIDRDLARLEKLEIRLGQAVQLTGEERRREWEKMVDEGKTLSANQKLISSHIEYNRFWQAQIARYRKSYDGQTAMYDAVFERQRLLDTLQAGDQVLGPFLRSQEEALSERIYEATHRASPPDFLQVDHPLPRRWIFRVPVYTDIEDTAFLEAFRSAAENGWRLVDGDDEFRVVIQIHRVPARQLYADGNPPARGEHIDLANHIERFPPGGAVLTTGANSTHVLGRSINLGPVDIPPNVLAHEFGHVLGFGDGYFRGYRDRGPEGFEVLEVVVEPDDFMSTPGAGPVGRRRFEKLLEALKNRRAP